MLGQCFIISLLHVYHDLYIEPLIWHLFLDWALRPFKNKIISLDILHTIHRITQHPGYFVVPKGCNMALCGTQAFLAWKKDCVRLSNPVGLWSLSCTWMDKMSINCLEEDDIKEASYGGRCGCWCWNQCQIEFISTFFRKIKMLRVVYQLPWAKEDCTATALFKLGVFHCIYLSLSKAAKNSLLHWTVVYLDGLWYLVFEMGFCCLLVVLLVVHCCVYVS